MVDIIEAIRDPNLINDEISPAQEVVLRALYGLEMTRQQVILLNHLRDEHFDDNLGEILWGSPEREDYTPVDYREGTIIVGRRGGKSDKLAANISIYEGCFREHKEYLSRGEEGYVLCLSQTMRTKVVFRYILGKLESSSLLSNMMAGPPKAEEIPLTNGITIACYPCSFKAVRGLTVVACVLDEIAFWNVEGVNPDSEVVATVRPGMATIPYARMIKISSPYIKAGELWNDYSNRDKSEGIFVVRAPTIVLNPTAREYLEREKIRDPINFPREYLGLFAEGSETFLPHAAIKNCIIENRIEQEYRPQFYYKASLDAAFKSDRFTFGIAHRDGDIRKLDVLRGWEGTREKPISLQHVIEEIHGLCQRYRIGLILGDQYCAQPIREALSKKNITFKETLTGGKERRKAYLTLKMLVLQNQIQLLDHKELVRELENLEIRRSSGGNFTVGHPRHGSHSDDFADAVALCVGQLEGGFMHPAEDDTHLRVHDALMQEQVDPLTGYPMA